MGHLKPYLLPLLASVAAALLPLANAQLSVTAPSGSGWDVTVSSATPGSDLPDPVTSPVDVATVSVTAQTLLLVPRDYEILVDHSAAAQFAAAGLALEVRRSSDGSLVSGILSSIYGGESFMGVDGTSQLFFWGSGSRSNIGIQFRITGLSVSTPTGIYSTTVRYTIASR